MSDVAELVPDKQEEQKDLGGSTPEPNTYAKGGRTDVYGNPTRARKGSTRPADIESQIWSMMGPSKRAREIAKRVKLASEGKAASAQRTAAYAPAGSDAESEVPTAASITDLQYMAEIDHLVDDAMRFHESTNTAAAARCSVRDVTNAIAKRVFVELACSPESVLSEHAKSKGMNVLRLTLEVSDFTTDDGYEFAREAVHEYMEQGLNIELWSSLMGGAD